VSAAASGGTFSSGTRPSGADNFGAAEVEPGQPSDGFDNLLAWLELDRLVGFEEQRGARLARKCDSVGDTSAGKEVIANHSQVWSKALWVFITCSSHLVAGHWPGAGHIAFPLRLQCRLDGARPTLLRVQPQRRAVARHVRSADAPTSGQRCVHGNFVADGTDCAIRIIVLPDAHPAGRLIGRSCVGRNGAITT
jgi:hypothetical protein